MKERFSVVAASVRISFLSFEHPFLEMQKFKIGTRSLISLQRSILIFAFDIIFPPLPSRYIFSLNRLFLPFRVATMFL